MDRLSPDNRSKLMSRVRGKNTAPELAVRKSAHALGLRFRLHRKDLPGTPDLVFPKWYTVIFVHGCFWHQHPNCKRATIPQTRHEFWMAKLARNVERDAATVAALENEGWHVQIIWECETKNPDLLRDRLAAIIPL